MKRVLTDFQKQAIEIANAAEPASWTCFMWQRYSGATTFLAEFANQCDGKVAYLGPSLREYQKFKELVDNQTKIYYFFDAVRLMIITRKWNIDVILVDNVSSLCAVKTINDYIDTKVIICVPVWPCSLFIKVCDDVIIDYLRKRCDKIVHFFPKEIRQIKDKILRGF